jgi:thioesterase domain-containing protein
MATSDVGNLDQKTGASGAKSPRDLLKLPVPFVAPRTRLETQIAAAFSDVLRVDPIGRDDEFYDLGGDSLAGEALSIEIERGTGRSFPISKLFRHGTPALIAQLLGDTEPTSAKPQGAVPESAKADGPAHVHTTSVAPEPNQLRIFMVHGNGGYMSLRPEFRDGLAPGREVTMFEMPGLRGGRRPIWRITTLARKYVEQMEAEQPEGPLHLAAFCSGSFIALEMAAILRKKGRPVSRLVLIDPYALPRVMSRHKAELALEQDPKAMSAVDYWKRTGRWRSGGVLDLAALLYGTWLEAQIHLDNLRNERTLLAVKYKNSGFAEWPRALLLAMFRFTWPEPYPEKVVILASEERAPEFARKDSVWRRLTPNAAVGIVTRLHRNLGKGEAGTRTARMLEHAMTRALKPDGTAAGAARRAAANAGK